MLKALILLITMGKTYSSKTLTAPNGKVYTLILFKVPQYSLGVVDHSCGIAPNIPKGERYDADNFLQFYVGANNRVMMNYNGQTEEILK